MKYHLEIEINQPRERVAELFGNPENLAFWQPGFVSLEHLSGEEGEAGSKSRLLYKNRGRDVEMIETVTVDNLPDEFSATYEAKGMLIAVNNRFEEAGPGRTRWSSDNEGQVSGIMMNMNRDQTNAIAIQVPSTLSSGCFHQMASAGG